MELEFHAQAALNALTADTDLDDWYEQLTAVTREVCRDAGILLKTRRTASVLSARAALDALHAQIGARKATQAQLAQLVVAKEKLIEAEGTLWLPHRPPLHHPPPHRRVLVAQLLPALQDQALARAARAPGRRPLDLAE